MAQIKFTPPVTNVVAAIEIRILYTVCTKGRSYYSTPILHTEPFVVKR